MGCIWVELDRCILIGFNLIDGDEAGLTASLDPLTHVRESSVSLIMHTRRVAEDGGISS